MSYGFRFNPFTGKLDQVLDATSVGTVTSVSGTANQIASTGGTTPVLSLVANPYVTGISFDSGSNILNSYVNRTAWTPALAFGGAAVGLTYAGRSGFYQKVGRLVFFTFSIELSAKGSSVGAATITGFPLTDNAIGIYPVSANNLTFTGNINLRIPGGGGQAFSIDQFASGGARSQLTDAAFVDTTYIQSSGCMIVNV